jgi:hypothetical protein
MVQVLGFVVALLTWWRRSPAGREAEIVYLRQQLIVLKRTAPDLRLPLPVVRFPARRVDHLHAKDLSPNRHSPVVALEVAAAA